jgi:hypothetical protein
VDWRNGTKVWCILRSYGTMTICGSKNDALDSMTRIDKLYSFVISEFKEEEE